MGCKNGVEKEEKNEIKKSVIDILKDEDNNDSKDVRYDLDYYEEYFKQKEQEELTKYNSCTNYPKAMLDIFNEIRKNPNSYANFIEDSMEYITETMKNGNKIFYYKKQLKVKINKGEPGFRDAAKELKTRDPVQKLELKDDLCIPLPSSVSDIKNKNYLKNQIANIRANRRVDAFFKDMIKNPEVSALLIMVDDNPKSCGKRRDIILRKDIKYVGISAGDVGGTFVAYFAFSG